ncbi:MAG: hypothetical protein HZB55_15550 [Deltaproteobacteria bacterium]|nr:hypothetical protein [Deltaproteobacteria bacterium]
MADEAKRALRVYMEQLSEDLWCAGWLTGLEFDLWTWVERRRAGLGLPEEGRTFGPPVDWELDADTLAWLAEQASGWWRWPEEGPGPVFVEREEWKERYQAWKQKS